MFEMLDEVVGEVGEELVIQVITDNAANYKRASELLMEKRKGLWWTPCAAHCIDLILEKIGDLPTLRTALRKAKQCNVLASLQFFQVLNQCSEQHMSSTTIPFSSPLIVYLLSCNLRHYLL